MVMGFRYFVLLWSNTLVNDILFKSTKKKESGLVNLALHKVAQGLLCAPYKENLPTYCINCFPRIGVRYSEIALRHISPLTLDGTESGLRCFYSRALLTSCLYSSYTHPCTCEILWFFALKHMKFLSKKTVGGFVRPLGEIMERALDNCQHLSNLLHVFTAK